MLLETDDQETTTRDDPQALIEEARQLQRQRARRRTIVVQAAALLVILGFGISHFARGGNSAGTAPRQALINAARTPTVIYKKIVTQRFVPDLPVTVTRETVAYFRREGPPPPSIVDLNAETGGHGMYSLHDPVHGLKAGAHHAGAESDPDTEASPDPAIVERISNWVRERFPDIYPEPVEAQTCLYTTTADRRLAELALS